MLFKKLATLSAIALLAGCGVVHEGVRSNLLRSDVSLNPVQMSVTDVQYESSGVSVKDAPIAHVEPAPAGNYTRHVHNADYEVSGAPQDFGAYPTEYTLDTGDMVRVVVYSQRTLTREYRVDASGRVSVPLAGRIYARGKTPQALEREIVSKLSGDILKDPKVSVEVVSYRPFYIMGEVRNAGQYQYTYGMSLEMAVAMAGGYTPRAKKEVFTVSRVQNGQRYRLGVSRNFSVLPGDTIIVKERRF